MKSRLLFAFALLVLLQSNAPQVRAEPGEVVLGSVYTLDSQALGEERTINVYLPPYYDPEVPCPVVYLLDGAVNEDYHHVSGLVQFLVTYELMPPSILVGVANVDRRRDFTHPTDKPEFLEQIPQAGNSENFARFLREELQPFVEGLFLTLPDRTLIGQSLGGLVATEIFMRWPASFDRYMIVSPSLWWDDFSLIDGIDAALRARQDVPGSLYLALGNEDEFMEEGMQRFVQALDEHAGPGLEWWYAPFPEETHATILHRSLYRGFELFYGDEYPGL